MLAMVATIGWTAALWAQQSKTGGTFTIGIWTEPDTLDPQKTGTAVTEQIFELVGQPLLAHDLSNRVVPGLAESWTISPNGLVWTFHLRAGVTFTDGTPVTADVVKASFERILAPETISPVAKAQLGPVSAVDALDARTLRLTLKQPFAPLLSNLTRGTLSPISVHAAEAAGANFGRVPVSEGPYSVKQWVSGHDITLVRNPAFTWGPPFMHRGPAYIDQIVFRIIPDMATEVAAFESGEMSQVTTPPHDVARLTATGKYQMMKFMRKGVGMFLEFNITKAPFSDIRLRRAMNYAINKDVLVKIALEGMGEAAYGPLPPSIWGYWPGIVDYAPHYDPAKAKQLFAEAGYTPGSDGMLQKNGTPLAFTLFTAPIDTWTRAMQLVQANLRSFGIRMDTQTYEFGSLLAKLKAGDQQANFMGYTYNEPDIMYIWFDSANIGGGLNFSHTSDPKLDALIDQARQAMNLTKRAALYAELQRYIVDKAIWVPVWVPYDYVALQPWVKDAHAHPDAYVFLGDAYLTKQ